jgi:sugar (pentulose or hexulose) kinase
MLDYLHVSIDQLPTVRESGEAVGELKPEVAKELGLSKKLLFQQVF